LPPAWALIAVVCGLPPGSSACATLLAGVLLGFCWGSGFWTASMQTIALVSVAVLIAVAIAFPLGILAARVKRFDNAIGPLLNIMQTVPPGCT
jgi:glycine betaine/proline transport system permease protein